MRATGELSTCSECWAVVETQHMGMHEQWHAAQEAEL